MKILKKIANLNINNIWKILFIFIFIGILYASLFETRYSFNPIIVLMLTIISMILISYIYKQLNKKFNCLSNKSSWLFYIIVTTIMIIFQIIIGYLVRTNPSWDLGIVIKSAQEMVKYGHSTMQAGYYIQAPNNIVITLIIAFALKVFALFKIKNIYLITLLVNILFIQLAIFLVFKITKKLFNNFTACFTLVFIFLFIPFYAYANICYTDTTSMFLPLAFLYIFIKLKDNSSTKYLIIYSVILGTLCFLSFGLKVTSIIMLIAYTILSVINKNIIKLAKSLGITLITFIILYVSYVFAINKTNIINMKYSETQVIPLTTHFVMMGMTGTGAFSAEEWQYTFSFPDKASRKEANINKIKERLSNYKAQGYIQFLIQKAKNYTWGDGTYDFSAILSSYNVDYNILHEFLLEDGKYYHYTFTYCQIYHFTMLSFILLSFVYSLGKKQHNSDYINICQLAIFGLLLFLLIWETRSRYMLNFFPIFLIISISGIHYLSQNISAILKRLFFKIKN